MQLMLCTYTGNACRHENALTEHLHARDVASCTPTKVCMPYTHCMMSIKPILQQLGQNPGAQSHTHTPSLPTLPPNAHGDPHNSFDILLCVYNSAQHKNQSSKSIAPMQAVYPPYQPCCPHLAARCTQ
eukprot:GHUV01009558.1.p1 GENE.GHUV01009558.1~~GHUV01009558.1.p1  ORF type:complete len:128 (-),score=0.33 GHUV01009558.1:62-445(-)